MRLINAIKIQANCENDSELRKLTVEQMERLAKLVEKRVPSGLASVDEWNEAIACFADTEPETDNERAKCKLLRILRGEE